MRWNCPHCGSNLAVADDKVGNGWSFSRCYKCGGFALVRRSDVNLVKVDRAPPGEHVLLPEANENPTAMLSKTATQNLARYGGANATAASAAASVQIARADNRKPVIRTATRRSPQQLQAAAQAQTQTAARAQAHSQSIVQAAAESQQATTHGFSLPEPLPEEPATGISLRLVPVAIAFTGMLAISSGVYLYVQGQALWEKAKMQASQSANPAPPPAAADTEASAALPPPSGTEVVQAPPIAAPGAPAATAPAAAVAIAAAAPPRPDLVDEVHANAMAPDRNLPAPGTQIQVELLTDSAHIHSGPGMNYPVIGSANNQKEIHCRRVERPLVQDQPRKPRRKKDRLDPQRPRTLVSLEETLFSGAKAKWLPLFRRLLARVSGIPGIDVVLGKTSITLSLAGVAASELAVIRVVAAGLEFRLALSKSHPRTARLKRITARTRPPMTHLVMLAEASHLDEELLDLDQGCADRGAHFQRKIVLAGKPQRRFSKVRASVQLAPGYSGGAS